MRAQAMIQHRVEERVASNVKVGPRGLPTKDGKMVTFRWVDGELSISMSGKDLEFDKKQSSEATRFFSATGN